MSTTVPQAPGLKRADIQEHDLSVPGRQVIQNRVDISPDAPLFRHKHPGEEVIYVLEGSLEYQIEGQQPTRVSAGEGLMGPARNGPRGEEHRHRQRGGARHVRRREREAIPRGSRLS
jgi:quercetin dioxygenase-like cupin family protein